MKKISLFLLLANISLLHAAPIIQNTDILAPNGVDYSGHSFTTPSGGSWNNITFNYFDLSLNPIAAGSLFILTQEYLGTPNALSVATPGFLAQSTGISGGRYNFDSFVTINPTTQYFVYMNGDAPITGLRGNPANPFPGGTFYPSTGAGVNYINFASADIAFSLDGDVVPVPEPSIYILFMVAMLGIGFTKRLKKLST